MHRDGFNGSMPALLQELFAAAAKSAGGDAYLWYPFSYAAGFHLRRATWCMQSPGIDLLGESALQSCAGLATCQSLLACRPMQSLSVWMPILHRVL